MEDYTIKTASILTRARLVGRYLITEVNPPLYFLVEIKNPRFSASSVAQTIIETTKKKYQEGITSSSQNFEEALRETNEALAKLTEEGQTEWLGNLSATIALIFKDKINLTSLGRSSCYLIRDRNLTEITEGQPEEVHPLKTFSHILSGSLEEGDKLIIGNQDFFDHLSLDYLKQILTKEEIKKAISHIARSLLKEKVKTASALFLEVSAKGGSAEALREGGKKGEISVSEKEEVIYLDQQKKLFGFWPKMKEAASFLGTCLRKFYSFLAPFSKKIVIKIGQGTLWIYQKLKISSFLLNLSEKTKGIFGVSLSRFFQKNKKRVGVLLLILLLCLLIFGVYALKQKQKRGELEIVQKQAVIQAQEKTKEAEEAYLKGDKELAKKLYNEAASLLLNIKTKEGLSLLSKITVSLDELNNIIKVKSPKEIVDFQEVFKEASVSQILVIDKIPYSVDLETNRVYHGKKEGGFLPQVSGRFVAATYQEADNLLIIYQDLEGTYEYNIEEKRAEKGEMVFEEKWEKAKILASYFSNLYLLDPEEGQIYKHVKTAGGYSKGTEVVKKDKINLKKAVSMAIDGYLYVLNNDGTVLKLLAGRPVSDFSIKGIPKPNSQIKKPTSIFTEKESRFLYILDSEGKRVLEFDKFGTYQRQFVFPNLSNLKDIWIKEKDKKMYLLSETKVYEIRI